MFQKVLRYAKAFVAGVTPVFLVVQSALTDNQITVTEWVGIVVAVGAAFGVYLVPNASAGARSQSAAPYAGR